MDPLQPAKIFFNPLYLEFVKKITKTLRSSHYSRVPNNRPVRNNRPGGKTYAIFTLLGHLFCKNIAISDNLWLFSSVFSSKMFKFPKKF